MATIRLTRVGTLALGALVLVSGCSMINDVQDATLTVTVSGTGDGIVTAEDLDGSSYGYIFGRIRCRKGSGTCSVTTDLDENGATTVILTAVPDPGSRFAGWDWCSPTPTDPLKATVRLDAEVGFQCSATFETISPAPACNDPLVLSSDFSDASVWELKLGDGSNGSYQPAGGNPDAFRLEEPDRPVNGVKETTVDFLLSGTYDPAVDGAVTGILYSEDRIVLNSLLPGEGITGGLYIWTASYPLFEGALGGGGLFTGNSWTTVSERFEAPDRTTTPFRVGYFRRIVGVGGQGVVRAGIDNVQISICR